VGTTITNTEPAQAFGCCPADLNEVHGCTLKPGHDGPHQSVEPFTGRVRAEWAR
jgi:hypothetical protein